MVRDRGNSNTDVMHWREERGGEGGRVERKGREGGRGEEGGRVERGGEGGRDGEREKKGHWLMCVKIFLQCTVHVHV